MTISQNPILIFQEKRCQITKYLLHPGMSLNFSHYHCDSFILVLEGTAIVTTDTSRKLISEQELNPVVVRRSIHKTVVENPGKITLVFIEICKGECFDD